MVRRPAVDCASEEEIDDSQESRRLAFALALVVAGGAGATLVVAALKNNVLYFYSPSDVATKHVAAGVISASAGSSNREASSKGPRPRCISW